MPRPLSKQTVHTLVPIIALVVALAFLAFYIFSGQGAANISTRQLQNTDPRVKSVQLLEEPAGQKNAAIKCQDGTTYDIYYPPGETNFEAVSSSKCPQD